MAITALLSAKFNHLDSTDTVVYPENWESRGQQYPELDQALNLWRQQNKIADSVSESVICEQAVALWPQTYPGTEVPKFNTHWAYAYKKRQSLEAQIVETTDNLEDVKRLVSQFDPQDVYNCDESSLFWKRIAFVPLNDKRSPKQWLRGHQGTKNHDSRLMTMICTNADGSDKLPPWLVCHPSQETWLKEQNAPLDQFECVLEANTKVDVTPQMVANWIMAFDRHVAPKNRTVVLVLDSANVHVEAISELGSDMPLQNTVLCLLPVESAAKSQPSNKGIFKTFKQGYSSRFIRFRWTVDTERDALEQSDVLKALNWVLEAWAVVLPQSILESWQKSGLIPTPPPPEKPQASAPIENITPAPRTVVVVTESARTTAPAPARKSAPARTTAPAPAATTKVHTVPTVPTHVRKPAPIPQTMEIIDLDEDEKENEVQQPVKTQRAVAPVSKVTKVSRVSPVIRTRGTQSTLDSFSTVKKQSIPPKQNSNVPRRYFEMSAHERAIQDTIDRVVYGIIPRTCLRR